MKSCFSSKTKLLLFLVLGSLWSATATNPMDQADCDAWKGYLQPRMNLLLGIYANQYPYYSPNSAIYQAMASHDAYFNNYLNQLSTMACPVELEARIADVNATETLVIPPSVDVLTIMTHANVEYRASLPAQEGMESFLNFMMGGSKRLGQFVFISESPIEQTNTRWMTKRRDPDYHVGRSGNGEHQIVFSGQEAYVGGGHLGQCQLVASEDLVANHQGNRLTLHWPMRAIYVGEETIGSQPLQGLTLYDIYLHYQEQNDMDGFMDLVEAYINGHESFGTFNLPARILARGNTSYKIRLKLNGQTQRSYGSWFGKRVNINLTQ